MARRTSITETRGVGASLPRPFLGAVLTAALLLAGCSPAEVAEQAIVPVPPTTPLNTESASTQVTTTTTAATAPTTTSPFGPKEVTVSWECDEIEGRDFGDLTFTCSAGRQPDVREFNEGYFNGVANFDLNDQKEKVAISMTAGGYNGYCMWSAEPGSSFDAPIEEGKAAFEGVLFGTDACEGLQFSFEATWDEKTLAISMNGVIEPAS